MIIRENLKNINWANMDEYHKRLKKYLKKNISKILDAADNLSLIDKQMMRNQASSIAGEEEFWMIQCEQYANYKRHIDYNVLYNLYYPLCMGARVNYGMCEFLLEDLIDAHRVIRVHIDDNYAIKNQDEDSCNITVLNQEA